MKTYNDFVPQDSELQRLWARLPEKSRQSRFTEAVQREAAVQAVMARPKSQSETKAIVGLVPAQDRSNVRRWLGRYHEQGFEGLISRRCPPPQEPMPEAVRAAICTLRQADPGIERKILALFVSPLLGGGRWDGIRVPRGELLEEICGEAYMPATLDRFTRELKYAGVANTLWESHARVWLNVTSGWGDPLLAVVFRS